MISALALLFGQGLLHGAGPDHCLAIGALAAKGDLRSAVAVSLRFGAGHTVVLALLAVGVTLTGFVIPARWEAALEVVGGVSLLALGCWTLTQRGALLAHVHADGSVHDGETPRDADARATQGVRGGRREDTSRRLEAESPPMHSWLSGVAGAVMGLSGVRGLAMLLPVAVRQQPGVLLAGVLLFGLGVVLAMVGVGWIAQRVATRARRVERAMRVLVGLASVLCGAWWVVAHLE